MMERSEILTTMAELKLYGMKAAFDEIISTAVKRQHEPQHVVGDLLAAEISEKQARSIRYQITIAKLPLAKDIDDFTFEARRRHADRRILHAAWGPDSDVRGRRPFPVHEG
jgi:hypothetical protein